MVRNAFYSFILFILLSGGSLAHEDELIVANSKAWKPFSYIDDEGKPRGILIDLWREYGRRNGKRIVFLLTDWNESLELVRRGEADAHAGLLWSEPRERFLDYSEPFFNIEAHLFFSQELVSKQVDEVISSGSERVGVVSGGFEEHFAREQLSSLELVGYPNNRFMLDAAIKGEINAFIADLQVANFYLYASHDPTHFVPVKHLYTHALHPAVAEGNKDLQKELNEGFRKISEPDKQRVLQRWMHIETVYPEYLVQVAVSAVSLMVIIYILSLHRTVKHRTRELEEANHNLSRLATIDPLTGIHNRRYFMEQLDQYSPGFKQLAVVVFDIDDFKQINDSFGHSVGDEVIKAVVRCLANALPKDALYARVGGEEFAAVLQELSFEEAVALSQELCFVAEQCQIEALPDHRKVTVSLGTAYYDYLSVAPTLNDADQLMYQAKKQGKNQAVCRKR